MSRLNPFTTLCLIGAATLAAMLWFASHDERWGLALAAAAFTIFAGYTGYLISSRERSSTRGASRPRVMAELSRITALVYAWGGTALITIYRFTPLHWQHGWQYGSAMLLVAAGLAAYSASAKMPGSHLASASALYRIVQLSALQGLATLGTLAWLTLSGKLGSPKGDWAANVIFMCGGVVVIWLSYLAVSTHRQLKGETV